MTLYWFKALHLISMVAWFAGLFYMFRLFVYHAENKETTAITDLLKIMERRLYKAITVPAMIATIVFGAAMLIVQPAYLKMPWLHMKLLVVGLLVAYTVYINFVRNRFLVNDVYLTSKQCRWRNEWPTLLLIVIVLLAVLKPFS